MTNTGNVTLGGPFGITDDKAADAACTDSTVAPGGTITCTGTYAVTQNDLDAGSVTNTATGTANFGAETITSNSDVVTIQADQKPSISLVKTATQPNYNAAGQTLDYTYLVQNTGNVTLTTPVTVVDDNVTRLRAYASGDATATTSSTSARRGRSPPSTTSPRRRRRRFGREHRRGHAIFGRTTVRLRTPSPIPAIQNPSLDLRRT